MAAIALIIFLALCAFAPLLTHAGDVDVRSRRGSWRNS
jgi:hypothetical protein